MSAFTLVPEPRIVTVTRGSGSGVSPVLDRASVDIGAELASGPTAAARILGVAPRELGVEAFAEAAGAGIPTGLDRAQGYGLSVSGGRVLLGADTPVARFHALQTLAQALATAPGAGVPAFAVWDWPRLPLRGFSLCYHMVSDRMPYLAPSYDTALSLVRWFAHLKMNALLLEPECMFPYRSHPRISSRIAFTPEQIRGLKEACEANHVAVIPLVQSIGHAYAVLRHREYAHLRELPDTSQQYCLCNEEVPRLYAELAGEVLEAFGSPRYFHIGGDESRRLGQCPRCRAVAAERGMAALYAEHVNRIARPLIERGITPMVWGDIMEDHPDILSRIDPAIAVVYWNYDVVDWSRPYAMERYASLPRQVFAASAARFGSQADGTFLYQKAMRNNGIMAAEAVRSGLGGLIVTDWPKLSPYDVGIVATCYGGAASWGDTGTQREFLRRLSLVLFGTQIPELDEMLRLVSETAPSRREILNSSWCPPFGDAQADLMPDWLDRMDASGRSFRQMLRRYTQQESLPAVEKELSAALGRADAALGMAARHAGSLRHERPLFEVLRLAAISQRVKCRMGLAVIQGVRLLKYPLPDPEPARLAARELREVLGEWEAARQTTFRTLLPRTFPESLERAMPCKFDPEAAEYMRRFAELLEAGETLQGLLDLQSW